MATVAGTLTLDEHRPVQGESITFSYTTDASHVSAKNWIGLYTDPGNGPKHEHYVGPSLAWEYAPGRSGHTTFSTAGLTPRDYIAYYLYDDGYAWLAQPVTFTVRAAPRVPPPTYRGAFGGPGGGVGQLAMPSGLSIAPDGAIWVADTGNDRVQAFTASGKPSRVVGEGVLRGPSDVAVAANGDVLVADSGHQRIAVFSAAGDHLRDLAAGLLDNPRGVAVDGDGQVYATDTVRGRLLVLDATTGTVLRTVKRKMSSPQGVTVAADGSFWVAQNSAYSSYRAAVVGYTADAQVITTLGANASSELGGLSNPSYVAVDGETLYVTLGDYGWTARFRTDGPFLDTFGSTHPATMRFPSGIALAGHDLYVADAWRSQILHFGVGG